MSLIKSTFKNLESINSKALVTYTVAGDPNLDFSERIISEIISSGADIIEIGVPFSDPMSEGPVIQMAHERSLINKTSLPDILSLSKKLKQKFKSTPIVLMGYFNTFINSLDSTRSIHDINDDICNELKKNGVDGLIIVDLPYEESEAIFKKLSNYEIDLIRLISPTTNDYRINEIISNSSGFLYYVSLKGITGAEIDSYDELKKRVKEIKESSSIPVVIGFGIKDRETASKMSSFADGVVVGSAIVDMISNSEKQENKLVLNKISKFVGDIKSSIQ
ncbi:MAG: tryptophan synthase subunit alpha [Gammaproteobacteria bacterium]|nr:MAG: tryptophan synthase subunit alpha [Gammaproteobacteria bacterium]|tara:strand:- start:495 stop:1325 length:831 start_codon:yes stop_codon:yes gene_type:complete